MLAEKMLPTVCDPDEGEKYNVAACAVTGNMQRTENMSRMNAFLTA